MRASAIAASVAALAASLAGCSVNGSVWGAEGANVIDTSARFIHAARHGDTSSLTCPGQQPDVRSPSDWADVHAEEPEKFDADHWPDLAHLHPAWTITLSTDRSAAPGDEQPGALVYLRTNDGLCVAEVSWMNVGAVSE